MPLPPAVDLGRVLPPRARQIVYSVFVVLLVVAFALDLAIDRNPEWLTAALRTLDGLAPLLLVLAAVNVPTGHVVDGEDATMLGSSHLERQQQAEQWGIGKDGDQ